MFAYVWLRDWDQFTNHDGSASATALPLHLQLPHLPHALSIIAITPQHLPPSPTILPPSHSSIMFFISFLLLLHSHIFPIMKLVFRFPTSTALYTQRRFSLPFSMHAISSLCISHLSTTYYCELRIHYELISLYIKPRLYTYHARTLWLLPPTAIFLHRRENNFPCSHLTTPITQEIYLIEIFLCKGFLSRWSVATGFPSRTWPQMMCECVSAT